MDDILIGDFKQEGTTLSDLEKSGELVLEEDKGKDTSASSPEENKPAETGTDQQKTDVPFHKHPRWQKMRESNNQLAQTVNELKTQIQSYEEKLSALSKSQTTSIPQWFTTLYGDNQEAWTQYQDARKQELETERAEIIKSLGINPEQMKKEQAQKATQSKADAWVDDQLDILEDEGVKFDRNELMKFTLENPVMDQEGNISFKKSLALMEKLKANPAKSEARKKIASSTTSESKSETPPKSYRTTAELRRKGWTF